MTETATPVEITVEGEVGAFTGACSTQARQIEKVQSMLALAEGLATDPEGTLAALGDGDPVQGAARVLSPIVMSIAMAAVGAEFAATGATAGIEAANTARNVRTIGGGGGGGGVSGTNTALRRVGDLLESAHDVMARPALLEGKTLSEVRMMIGHTPGWVNDVMRRSTTNPNGGWVFREMNSAGTDFTGRMIQFHPGTRRHFGGDPYWKVSGVTNEPAVRLPAGR